MRRLGWAIAAFGAAAGSAFAADVAVYVPPPMAPPPAPMYSPVSSILGLYAGWGTYNDDDGDYTGGFGVVGGEGRANVWFDPNFSLQGDVEFEATTAGFDNCCDEQTQRILGNLGVHLSMRDPNSHLLGAFMGVTGTSIAYTEGTTLNWMAGVEGQWYSSNSTLYGQLGYSAATRGDEQYSADFWFARLVGRHFVTANDKVQAEIGGASGHYTDYGDIDDPYRVINWGALYEHKFANPISVYLEYAGFHAWNDVDDYNDTEHQVMAGFKIYGGQDTLLSNDRNGATLDLPKIGRPLFWAYELY